MSSFSHHFSAASPVLTMSSQSPFGASAFTHQHVPSPSPMGHGPAVIFASQQRLSGRKRSRDEASVNLDSPSKPQEREEDWFYGPGMVLIKANAGYVAEASSQSGTWLEEKQAVGDEDAHQHEKATPESRSHKLQRIQPVTADDTISLKDDPTISTTFATQNSREAPIIDDFTLHLGIGWRKISPDEHIQAAARGWARYIENHYPVSNAQIRLESQGLQSYLVEASEGFFLFAENLRRGQFVSATAECALRNLQTSPPTFDDSNVLFATTSPPPMATEQSRDAEMKLD